MPSKIIFYDGLCPMCNAWVSRLLRYDKKGVFRFASLQSDFAGQLLGEIFPDYLSIDTILLYDEGKIYTASTAVLRIFKALGAPWRWLSFGLILPVAVRDLAYRWVADRRYRFGGRFEECPLPPAAWRDRFLS